ncbi:hypothetical protein H2200_001609 [Cladophialophora chaetospira]|uniref:Uncharacterized protein n=1 Tax=Cladophialophora chaetospira TaxID=386627 RepID=A0AA39CP85_9EURO|nr:hypothetical protein H2200_001609 [Cladophialophora chaetospira]
MVNQKELDAFYSIDNLVTLNIKMQKWDDLRKASPRGGFGFKEIQTSSGWLGRYDWMTAESVSISGSKFLTTPRTFNNVPIIKKSYGGSRSETKPSFKLNFGKGADGATVEQLIGTKELTLNNCKQDPAFVRQPFGYQLFQKAGVPAFRCNFAKVTVNGADVGVFVNLESFKKPFLERNFTTSKGNAYEVEYAPGLGSNLTIDQGNVNFEGSPDPKADPGDVHVASTTIASMGVTGAAFVLDMDEFIKFTAMESLLKHWDGYTQQMNNTYLYNDKHPATTSPPKVVDVKIKFIPSGIDQILQDPAHEGRAAFHIGDKFNVTQLMMQHADWRKMLFDQIRKYANELFSPAKVDGELKAALDGMEKTLTAAGARPMESSDSLNVAIAKVREQVRQVRQSAINVVGAS